MDQLARGITEFRNLCIDVLGECFKIFQNSANAGDRMRHSVLSVREDARWLRRLGGFRRRRWQKVIVVGHVIMSLRGQRPHVGASDAIPRSSIVSHEVRVVYIFFIYLPGLFVSIP